MPLTQRKNGNKSGKGKLRLTNSEHQTPQNRRNPPVRGRNTVARTIINKYTTGVPKDDEIRLAIGIQQSQSTGALKKVDYIAILTRLNSERDNALISQYKVQDLIDLIRYELYTKHIESMTKVKTPVVAEEKAKIEVVDDKSLASQPGEVSAPPRYELIQPGEPTPEYSPGELTQFPTLAEFYKPHIPQNGEP